MARTSSPRARATASAACPTPPVAELARERGAGCHVDASLGSFFLPFAERLGRAVPPWDFRVPGVTSMSGDVHKFGYSAKGASVVLYRGSELRRFQFFASDQWSGGVFASPGVLGTRPGGTIAAAWAALHALGDAGYRQLVAGCLETAEALQRGIRDLGLEVLGNPATSVFAFGDGEAAPGTVRALADRMETRGWHLDRLQSPDAIHLIITANHRSIVPEFLADLAASLGEVRAACPQARAAEGAAVLYGVTGDVAADGDRVEAALTGLEGRWSVRAASKRGG